MEGIRPIGEIVDSCFISHSDSLEDSISLLRDCPWNELTNHLEMILLRIEREGAQGRLWKWVFSSLFDKLHEGRKTLDAGVFGDILSSTIKTALCHIDKYQSVEPQKKKRRVMEGFNFFAEGLSMERIDQSS